MAFQLALLCLFLINTLVFSVEDNSKRILVNDKDYVDSDQMHRDIQNLKATLSHLQDQMVSKETQQKAEILALTQQVQSQQKLITNLLSLENSGAVYTRWGRKDCKKNGTELVYSGIVAGGDSRDSGSPAQPVCAPHDPDLGPDSSSSKFAPFYGAEYEDNYFGANLLNNDVPCAVCRALKVTSAIMIPAKAKCHTGWTMEYSGNLAGGHYPQAAASNYVCLDSSPEVLEGGHEDRPGTLFVPVKAWCVSLKCPPYIVRRDLKCVVCVK